MTSLTQNGFGNWLLKQSPDEVVGFPEDPSDCPLCRYLHIIGVPDPRVDLTYYRDRPHGGGIHMLPEWASKFQLNSIDLVGMLTDKVRPITAFQAGNALNKRLKLRHSVLKSERFAMFEQFVTVLTVYGFVILAVGVFVGWLVFG